MAGRTRRIQLELNIPANAIFGLAGKGLGTDPEGPWLQVNNGAGLTFFEDKLCPDLHPSGDLHIHNEKIAVNLSSLANKLAGPGLKIVNSLRTPVPDAEGDVTAQTDWTFGFHESGIKICPDLSPNGGLVITENGIAVDTDVIGGKVAAAYAPGLAGSGLTARDGKLHVELEATPVEHDTFKVVTGTNLSLDAKTLILTKHLTTFAVQKNAHGFVVGIVPVGVEVQNDPVTLPDGYGYGFAAAEQAAAPNTKTLPNFYE